MRLKDRPRHPDLTLNRVKHRIYKLGWPLERALTEPPRKCRSYADCAPCKMGCSKRYTCKGLCRRCYDRQRRAAIRTGTWPNREAKS